jgi:hypothetical protein
MVGIMRGGGQLHRVPRGVLLLRNRGIVCGAIGSIISGIIALFVLFNEHANRLFAKKLDLICFPIDLLLATLLGSNDSYLLVFFVVGFIYMLAIGFLIGFLLHKLFSKIILKTGFP